MAVDAAASDDNFDGLAPQTVTVAVTDDDVAGFTVTPTGGGNVVNENGSTDTFDVVLTAQPAADVVLTLSNPDAGEVTVSPATLTFTPANWNVPQAVTLAGVADGVVDGTQTTTLTLAVDDAASDDAFDAVADQPVNVQTVDDTPGLIVTESGGSTAVAESGTTDSLTVVLSAPPASDVTLAVTVGGAGEVAASAATLVFTPANWNVPQTVTVTGVDDFVDDGDQTVSVVLSVEDAASDDRFDNVAARTVAVLNADDDTAGVAIVQTDGDTDVNERGTTDTFRVKLTSQPTADVVLLVASADTGEAAVDVARLTFTPANWNVEQTVTVTGVDDTEPDGTQLVPVTLAVDDAASDPVYGAGRSGGDGRRAGRRYAGLYRESVRRRHDGRRERHDGHADDPARQPAHGRRGDPHHQRRRGRVHGRRGDRDVHAGQLDRAANGDRHGRRQRGRGRRPGPRTAVRDRRRAQRRPLRRRGRRHAVRHHGRRRRGRRGDRGDGRRHGGQRNRHDGQLHGGADGPAARATWCCASAAATVPRRPWTAPR